jgi:hypothetical protein
MILSSPTIHPIDQKIQEVLLQQGIKENEPFRQNILLKDSRFAGYRFIGKNVQVEWLAQQFLMIVRNNEGKIIFESQLPEIVSQFTPPTDVLQSNHVESPAAA